MLRHVIAKARSEHGHSHELTRAASAKLADCLDSLGKLDEAGQLRVWRAKEEAD